MILVLIILILLVLKSLLNKHLANSLSACLIDFKLVLLLSPTNIYHPVLAFSSIHILIRITCKSHLETILEITL